MDENRKDQLERMTVKELREIALSIGTITGVHAMKKEELIVEIKEAKGIVDEKGVKYASELISKLKATIRTLRKEKEQAREAGDKKRIKILQRKLNRLKKRTRKAAA